MHIAKDVHIDPFRVYQTGFSQGGHESLRSAWKYPDWFAGVVPVAPDLRLPNQWFYFDNVKWVKNVPVRLAQGHLDGYIDGTLQVYLTMMEAGCPVEMITYPAQHSAICFRNLDWFNTYISTFFARQVLNPYPRTVYHAVEFADINRYSRAFWVNGRMAENLRMENGGYNPVYQVSINPSTNLISIDTADGAFSRFEFYLDSNIADMSKPVTVVKGGQTVHEGDIPADGKVTATLYNVWNKPPTPTTKASQVLAKHVGNGDPRALWQKLDSIRCTVFGVCGVLPDIVSNSIKYSAQGQEPVMIDASPNPFSTSTEIRVNSSAVPQFRSSTVNMEIQIYNINGKLVEKQVNCGTVELQHCGTSYRWHAQDHPAGIYMVRVKSGDRVLTKAITLVK
jgi:hypothetical protein